MTLNLVQHRAGRNLWQRRLAGEWDTERWVLAALAGALMVAGLRRRSVPGLLIAAAGASLGCWATTGLEARRMRRGHLKQVWPERLGGRRADDEVMEASEESFPASDAPSWTPITGNR